MHLAWAVRRLTPTQSKYIRLFYGAEVLHQLEELEHRNPVAAHVAAHAHAQSHAHGQAVQPEIVLARTPAE